MTMVDPHLIKPAMDAISDGWAFGRASRSIQFVKFEYMVDQPLSEVRAAYGLLREQVPAFATPLSNTPELLAAA
jgi:ubiquinone biosynthesis protein Coq4